LLQIGSSIWRWPSIGVPSPVMTITVIGVSELAGFAPPPLSAPQRDGHRGTSCVSR
jgi:hypothetical protein